MSDALMVGVVLTLVFGSVVFYLYNRVSMTERKISLIEGVITDLKVMMDSVPYAMGPMPPEYQTMPDYLTPLSGPIPLQQDEMEDIANDTSEQDLEGVLEKTPLVSSEQSERNLQIEEHSETSSSVPVNVTKLLPDLDSMSVKELGTLAKEKGISVPSGTRKKELLELLKKTPANLEGPEPSVTGASLDAGELETTL